MCFRGSSREKNNEAKSSFSVNSGGHSDFRRCITMNYAAPPYSVRLNDVLCLVTAPYFRY